MMTIKSLGSRIVTGAIALCAGVGGMATPTFAQSTGTPPNCGYIARVVCQHEPGGLTIECFEREYQICVDLYGGE